MFHAVVAASSAITEGVHSIFFRNLPAYSNIDKLDVAVTDVASQSIVAIMDVRGSLIDSALSRSSIILPIVLSLWACQSVYYWWYRDYQPVIQTASWKWYHRFYVSRTGIFPRRPPVLSPGMRSHPNYTSWNTTSILVHVLSVVLLAIVAIEILDYYVVRVNYFQAEFASPWWVRVYPWPKITYLHGYARTFQPWLNTVLSYIPLQGPTIGVQWLPFADYQYSLQWFIDETIQIMQRNIMPGWFTSIVLLLSACGPVIVYHPKIPSFLNVTPLRTMFRNMVLQAAPAIAKNHSHPHAAAARNAANNTIDDFIRSTGYIPYSFQMSANDVAKKLDGCLSPYWPSDLHSRPRSDPLKIAHFIKIINVDYYFNPSDLFWTGQPIIMFTFTPRTPCGEHHDYKWCTLPNNKIRMEVRGVDPFEHPLWDYNHSHLTKVIHGVAYTYFVESVPVDTHWSYILLTPCAYTAPYKGYELVQRQLVHTVHTLASRQLKTSPSTVAIMTDTKANIILAKLESYTSVVVPSHIVVTIQNHARLGTLQPHDLVNMIGRHYCTVDNDSRTAASIIHACLPIDTIAATSTPSSICDEDIHYRRVNFDTASLKEKLTGHIVCPPIIPEGFMPTRCKDNDRWTVEERVVAVRNTKSPPAKYLRYQGEFMELLFPEPHVLQPITIPQVVESQKRPTQRANNMRALPSLLNFMDSLREYRESPLQEKKENPVSVSSFQKGEVYPSLKDPRNISTLPTEHCLLYSQYTQPMAAHLKTTSWYAFGMHPDQVARAVHSLATGAATVCETDFSRFDGTHSMFLHEFELALMLRAYHPTYHAEIRDIHHATLRASATTSHGVQYDIGGSRLSGCADTSLGNSLDNAFVAFCVYREMGQLPLQAYRSLGLYGGDDGVSADADDKIYVTVTEDIGLKIKVQSRSSLHPIGFLGRIYPSPQGSPGHLADLPRQLKKLHIVPTREPLYISNPFIVHYNRALSILVTDPDTPILSAWARMVLRLAPQCDRKRHDKLDTWIGSLFEGRNEVRPTPHMAMESACSQLGLTSQEIKEYELILDNLTDIRMLPLLYKPDLPVIPPMIQLGNVIGPIPSDTEIKRSQVPSSTLAQQPPPYPTTPPPPLPSGAAVLPPATPTATATIIPAVRWAHCHKCNATLAVQQSSVVRLCVACTEKRTPIRGESAEMRRRKIALIKREQKLAYSKTESKQSQG